MLHKGQPPLCLYKAKPALSPFPAFPCHSQLPETCSLRALSREKHRPGRAVGAAGGKAPSRSRWPGRPVSGIGDLGHGRRPLFSLGVIACSCVSCSRARLVLLGRHSPSAAGPQGHPSTLVLTNISSWSGSGQRAWPPPASPACCRWQHR